MAAKKEPTNKGGRPSKLDTLDMEHVKKLAVAGWTDAQMADFFEVSEQTWNNWKKKKSSFYAQLQEWKAEFDERVERALGQRAIGYSHPDVHISNYQGEITVTDITKHYPPDTTACIFWLKNRKPDEWRDKRDHEHSGPEGGPIEVTRIEIVPGGQNGKG